MTKIMDIEAVDMGGEALAKYGDLTPKTNSIEIKDELDGGILVSLEDAGTEGESHLIAKLNEAQMSKENVIVSGDSDHK